MFVATSPVSQGLAALAGADWEGARRAFSSAIETCEDPAALEGLGEALWWLNDLAECHATMRRAYRRYRSTNQPVAAARVAIFLARDYLDVYANFAAYNGWLARAETLLEQTDELCAERGWLLLVRVRVPSPEALVANAKAAIRIARATADADLECVALSYLGTGLVWLGRSEEGMTRLDEAMAGVTAGEVESSFAAQESISEC
jgi:hypothetical protein